MKLKLNIQKFSSTNATTHYELSQYVGSDKPTYLVDYNSDMNKIDTGIYNADAQATQNANNIGTMSNLNTTEKSSLVGAINEVNTQVGVNTGNISTNTSNISTLGNNQGVMANLTTTEKSSLVGAINEVDAVNDTQTTNITKNATDIATLNAKFNFTNINSYTQSDLSINTGTLYTCDLTVASNSDYSVMKVYGRCVISTGTAYTNNITISGAIPSGYRPSTEISVKNGIVPFISAVYTSVDPAQFNTSMTLKTNGDIVLTVTTNNNSDKILSIFAIPFITFVKDFGDTPAE